ncbi:MAG: DUF6599 family protein [bacterium]
MRNRLQFPSEVDGWHTEGAMQTYGRDTVFEYMDGAGELYLAYDFRRVRVQRYRKPDAPSIVAEAYEMSTSQDAYGVFTHDPEGEDVGVGQGNAYAVGLLRLWKGRYFFRILAERDTPQAKAAVVALARSLAEGLPRGPRPALLDRLPSEDLDASSVRYFHTQVSLNSLYYLGDANFLHLSPRTEAALAVYRPDGEKMTLLVVRYPSSQQAKEAYRDFDRVYVEDDVPAEWPLRIEAVEDGRRVGALVKGDFLALVFDAPSRQACERLLREAAHRL